MQNIYPLESNACKALFLHYENTSFYHQGFSVYGNFTH